MHVASSRPTATAMAMPVHRSGRTSCFAFLSASAPLKPDLPLCAHARAAAPVVGAEVLEDGVQLELTLRRRQQEAPDLVAALLGRLLHSGGLGGAQQACKRRGA